MSIIPLIVDLLSSGSFLLSKGEAVPEKMAAFLAVPANSAALWSWAMKAVEADETPPTCARPVVHFAEYTTTEIGPVEVRRNPVGPGKYVAVIFETWSIRYGLLIGSDEDITTAYFGSANGTADYTKKNPQKIAPGFWLECAG